MDSTGFGQEPMAGSRHGREPMGSIKFEDFWTYLSLSVRWKQRRCMELLKICKISGLRRGIVDVFILLDCYTKASTL